MPKITPTTIHASILSSRRPSRKQLAYLHLRKLYRVGGEYARRPLAREGGGPVRFPGSRGAPWVPSQVLCPQPLASCLSAPLDAPCTTGGTREGAYSLVYTPVWSSPTTVRQRRPWRRSTSPIEPTVGTPGRCESGHGPTGRGAAGSWSIRCTVVRRSSGEVAGSGWRRHGVVRARRAEGRVGDRAGERTGEAEGLRTSTAGSRPHCIGRGNSDCWEPSRPWRLDVAPSFPKSLTISAATLK